MSYKRRTDIEIGDIETIWVEVKFKNSKPILLCSAYRPPSSRREWIENFAKEINIASSSSDQELILMGDFNIDISNCPPKYWSSVFDQYDFKQIITNPTRVSSTRSTLIDHIYTNKPDNVCEINVPCISLSDHYPVCATRKLQQNNCRTKPLEIKYRDFKNFNDNAFLQDLSDSEICRVTETNDPNEALSEFYESFRGTLDKHAKVKLRRVEKQFKPLWFNDDIKEARKTRDRYHKNKDDENYRFWRNKVTTLIKQAKTNYYESAVKENKTSGDIWRHIKELNPKQTTCTPEIIKTSDQVLENPEDIANEFNNYFVNICQTLGIVNKNNESTFSTLDKYVKSKLDSSKKFNISLISENQVFKLLNKLNSSKSAGVDTVGPRILKLAAPVISRAIAHIINTSIKQGIFPDELKKAKVSPIFKSGDKETMGNYRPISVLPTILKIFEQHIASQLNNFLNDNHLLSSYQSGFRKFHSCQSALIQLSEEWLSNMDNGCLTGITFLDFRKAFDLVDHEILLQKLECYSFDSNALTVFKSYLNNRQQSVHIGTTESKFNEIKSGVPQGSVLGPILFLLYINDLPLHVKHSQIALFADDTTIHGSSKSLESIEENMQKDLDNINKWCDENKMKINENKTNCMLLGTNQRLANLSKTTLDLKVNDIALDNVKNQKLLGVEIDSHLDYNVHLDKLCKNISSKLALLKRIKRYLNLDYRKLFYNGYVLPLINYCIVVWSNTSKTNLLRIHKLQKYAARIILDAAPDAPSKPLFDELNWLNIFEKINYQKSILLYKIKHEPSPSYLHQLFPTTYSTSRVLRSKTQDNLNIPRPNTEKFKHSFQYSGARLWNDLPANIRNSNSLYSFKNSMLKHIKSKRDTH